MTLAGSGTADLYVEGTGDASRPGRAPARASPRACARAPSTSRRRCRRSSASAAPSTRSRGPISTATSTHLLVPLLDPAGGIPDPDGLHARRDRRRALLVLERGPHAHGRRQARHHGARRRDRRSALAAGRPARARRASSPTPLRVAGPPELQDDRLAARRLGGHVVLGADRGGDGRRDAAARPHADAGHDPRRAPGRRASACAGRRRFDDQAGAGEVDVLGAVAAVDRLRDPAAALPVRSESWLTARGGRVPRRRVDPAAGGARAARGAHGRRRRLLPTASRRAVWRPMRSSTAGPYEGAAQLARRGPGVWIVTVQLPAGLGLSHLTVGATFDGVAHRRRRRRCRSRPTRGPPTYPCDRRGRLRRWRRPRGRPARARAAGRLRRSGALSRLSDWRRRRATLCAPSRAQGPSAGPHGGRSCLPALPTFFC